MSSRQVDRRLGELYEAGFRRIVLDLRAVTFIDSTGLHLILSWDARAKDGAAELALIPGPRAVQRLFEITGVRDRLPFR